VIPIFCRPWTALGTSLGFPAGHESGLPLGLQLNGRRGSDRLTLGQAARLLDPPNPDRTSRHARHRKIPFTPTSRRFTSGSAPGSIPRLRQLLFDLTDIHSPTGATRAASEFIAGKLGHAGLPCL
jgi:hypothetical protein